MDPNAPEPTYGPSTPVPGSQSAPLDPSESSNSSAHPISIPLPSGVNLASQLEAEELDADLISLLTQQTSSIFRYFAPQTATAYTPEIELALRALVYRHCTAAGAATPGAALQGLVLRRAAHGPSPLQALFSALAAAPTTIASLLSSASTQNKRKAGSVSSLSGFAAFAAEARAGEGSATGLGSQSQNQDSGLGLGQSSSSHVASGWDPAQLYGPGADTSPFPALTTSDRRLYVLLCLLLPWALQRWRLFLSSALWGAAPPSSLRARLYVLTERLTLLLRVAAVANALVFLRSGRFVSLAHRALGLRLSWAAPRAAGRALAFDVLTQVRVCSISNRNGNSSITSV